MIPACPGVRTPRLEGTAPEQESDSVHQYTRCGRKMQYILRNTKLQLKHLKIQLRNVTLRMTSAVREQIAEQKRSTTFSSVGKNTRRRSFCVPVAFKSYEQSRKIFRLNGRSDGLTSLLSLIPGYIAQGALRRFPQRLSSLPLQRARRIVWRRPYR